MKGVEKIMDEIEVLREKLLKLIGSEESLLDPEVIYTSQLLDRALNDYIDSYINSKLSSLK